MIARTLFILVEEEILFLHGCVKKTMKTPQSELALAKRRKQQYLQSHEKE